MSNHKTVSRTSRSTEFKAKIALEAHKGDKTINEIALTYQIHPGQVAQWKALLKIFSSTGVVGNNRHCSLIAKSLVAITAIIPNSAKIQLACLS